MTPRLELDRDWVLFDDQPAVLIVDAEPRSEVTLKASMVDQHGVRWCSEATFLTDIMGRVNLDQEPPLKGSYFGLSPNGLFWSMVAASKPFTHSGVEPLEVELRLEQHGEEVARAAFKRGFEAPQPPKVRLILLLSGLFGSPEGGTALLRSRGCEVHAFHVGQEEPVEISQRLEEIAQLPETELPTVLCGSGRGGELALILATYHQGFDGVVTFSGSGLAFPGWMLEGQPYPCTELDPTVVIPREPVSTRKMYSEAVIDRANRDRGRIPVERIEAPILLLSGADDHVWPSAAFSELVFQRIKKLKPGHPCLHRPFPDAGHFLGPEFGFPHQPTTQLIFQDPATNLRRSSGGTKSHQAHAQRESWRCFLDFLEKIAAGEPPFPA